MDHSPFLFSFSNYDVFEQNISLPVALVDEIQLDIPFSTLMNDIRWIIEEKETQVDRNTSLFVCFF